jgi:anti-sigma regulatory factor (Ser/Thr protein kinase)
MAEIEPTPEEQVVSVAVSADAGLLPPVIEFVARMVQRLGLGDIGQIDGAVELVCMNVIEHAFGPEEKGSFDVRVMRGPGRVVVAVEDRGLPFDYSRLQTGEDGTVLETLHRAFDGVRFVNL